MGQEAETEDVRQQLSSGDELRATQARLISAADAVTLLAANLVAQLAYELFADPELVAAAWRDFRGEP